MRPTKLPYLMLLLLLVLCFSLAAWLEPRFRFSVRAGRRMC